MDFDADSASSLASFDDSRRYSHDFQEHLRRVSDVVTKANPRRAARPSDGNGGKKHAGLKSSGRSQSVVSLVSMAVPALANNAVPPEVGDHGDGVD